MFRFDRIGHGVVYRISVNDTKRKPGNLRLLVRLLSLCRGSLWVGALVVLFNVLHHGVHILGLKYVGASIDFLLVRFKDSEAVVHWPPFWQPDTDWQAFDGVLFGVGAILSTALLKMVFQYLAAERMAQFVHVRILPQLQDRIFNKIQNMSFSFYDKESTGSIINRAAGDVQSVRSFVDSVLVEGLTMVVTVLFYGATMFAINPVLSLACMGTVPVILGLSIAFSLLVRPRLLQSRTLFDRMVLSLSEYIDGIKTVKGLSLERELGAELHHRNDDVQNQQNRIFLITSIFSPAINLASQMGLVVLLIYGGKLAIDGQLAVGSGLVVFASLLQQFSNQVTTFSHVIAAIQESLTGAQRIFELLDTPIPVSDPEQPVMVEHLKGDVTFDRVTFEFKQENTALEDISFSVPAGSCVALMGETGSGKSALLHLLARFYDPVKGRVMIDGFDIRSFPLDFMRKNVGVLFQESFLFNDTVYNNIRYGKPDASREEVEAAARKAHAHDFVCQLEGGYDAVIREGAKNLSGGQRQRIGLARVLISDPAILLLDDPSSALDSKTERAIFEAIADTIHSRTTFMVAHRVSTLERADIVIVLKHGRIVQMGSHSELMLVDGPYRDAAELQMAESWEDESSLMVG